MKLVFVLISLVLMATPGIAQNASKPSFSAKDSLLCREWKIKSYTRFGLEHLPDEKQKNDNIVFTKDMKVKMIRDGISQSGTWSTDKYKTYINMVLGESNEKLMYKLMSVNDKELVFEYQEPSLIRTIYNYEVK